MHAKKDQNLYRHGLPWQWLILFSIITKALKLEKNPKFFIKAL